MANSYKIIRINCCHGVHELSIIQYLQEVFDAKLLSLRALWSADVVQEAGSCALGGESRSDSSAEI